MLQHHSDSFPLLASLRITITEQWAENGTLQSHERVFTENDSLDPVRPFRGAEHRYAEYFSVDLIALVHVVYLKRQLRSRTDQDYPDLVGNHTRRDVLRWIEISLVYRESLGISHLGLTANPFGRPIAKDGPAEKGA